MSKKESSQDQLEIVRNNIRNLRISRGWNITQLAEKTGILLEDLIAIEDGADCRLDYLRAISDVFHVRMTQMFRPLKEFHTER